MFLFCLLVCLLAGLWKNNKPDFHGAWSRGEAITFGSGSESWGRYMNFHEHCKIWNSVLAE